MEGTPAPEARPNGPDEPLCGLVLTGGGARAAYQIGVLRSIARRIPEERLQIVTGVSAGAINAAYVASRPGSLAEAVERLTEVWRGLTADQVFDVSPSSLAGNFLRWGLQLVSGGAEVPGARSLVDTAPLRHLVGTTLRCVDGAIAGIGANHARGRLHAVALSALKYATGQTVTWVEGAEIAGWERPMRVGIRSRIGVDHVLASAALPLMFPAVRVGNAWYGDGGIRLQAPLAPAIHLGASRILAVSTRYPRSLSEASTPAIEGYPPFAQVAGTLLNAIFLDAFDSDAERLERVNALLDATPPERWAGRRPVRLLVMRPSRDLGRLAADYEPQLPAAFRFLTRGLGTRETKSPDILSLLMFQGDYLTRLIEIGEADAEARGAEIEALFS
jgi:NTE family protein